MKWLLLLCIVAGSPRSLPSVVATINPTLAQVDFTWDYDNSVNVVPVNNFSLTITLSMSGQVILTRTVEAGPGSRSYMYSVLFSDLMSNQAYTVNVVARNLQGSSEAVAQFFNTPISGGVGKQLRHCLYIVPYLYSLSGKTRLPGRPLLVFSLAR